MSHPRNRYNSSLLKHRSSVLKPQRSNRKQRDDRDGPHPHAPLIRRPRRFSCSDKKKGDVFADFATPDRCSFWEHRLKGDDVTMSDNRSLKGVLCFAFVLALSGFVYAQSGVDTFEASTLNPFWTLTEQYGTVRLSTGPNHTFGGKQSLKFTSSDGGQRDIFAKHTFASPQKGTFSIWFYNAAPDQETQYEQILSIIPRRPTSRRSAHKTSTPTAMRHNCSTTTLRYNRVPTNTAAYILRSQRLTYAAQ